MTTTKEIDKNADDTKTKTKRTIRRVADVKNSELFDIAKILMIRTTIPRSQAQRQDLIKKIRRVL